MSRSRSATTKQRSRVISARDASRNEKGRPMRKKPKPPTRPIPRFRSEAEEREFWETHDSADYVDLSKAQRARFPNLKLSTTSISLRVPQGLLDRIKIAANKRDVPYQSLIKVWLAEKLDAE
jgi:predicted DNA binding CopG/RHH family protein